MTDRVSATPTPENESMEEHISARTPTGGNGRKQPEPIQRLRDHNHLSRGSPRKSILKVEDRAPTPEDNTKSVKFLGVMSNRSSQNTDSRFSITIGERRREIEYLKILEAFYVEVVRENNTIKDKSISMMGPLDSSMVDNLGDIIRGTKDQFKSVAGKQENHLLENEFIFDHDLKVSV